MKVTSCLRLRLDFSSLSGKLAPASGSSDLPSNFKLCFTVHCVSVWEVANSSSIFLFRKLHRMDCLTAVADFIFYTNRIVKQLMKSVLTSV